MLACSSEYENAKEASVEEEDCEEGDPAYAVCRHVSRVVTEV